MTTLTDINNLLADLVALDDIAEPVFNLKPRTARLRAAVNALPVPAFRLNSSRKGPLYVHKSDLESYLKTVHEKAKSANSKMKLAGAV